MNWFSLIPMVLMWIMELALFVLAVIVLIELIKFLKLKNKALKVEATKPKGQPNAEQDPQ